jgi:nucleoside-diphosphate-sugar epimerase
MKQKILVTGGAGYIGSVLTTELLGKGYKVVILDRFIFGGESLLGDINNPDLTIIEGDIRDKKVLKSLPQVDSAINLAALVGEPACVKDPKVTKSINQDGAIHLAAYLKKRGIERFIMASTCSNYGLSKGTVEATEESNLHPLSLYATTKIAAEKGILALESKTFHPIVVRLATIFGLSPNMRFNLLVNGFAKDTALGGDISVVNKDAWRPFLHVQDAARAFITILEADMGKISGEIFNVVGQNIQKGKLAQMAKRKNPKVSLTLIAGKLDDGRDYKVSAKKILNKLGFKPQIMVEQGFNEVMNAVKKGVFLDLSDFHYNAWYDDKVFEDSYAKNLL